MTSIALRGQGHQVCTVCSIIKSNLLNIGYIGETNRHFHTRVNEHLFRDKNSHVFKHLNCSRHCRDSCDASSFKIIDSAKTFSQLKIKESFHIERSNPELNKQVEHVNLTLHF